MFTVFWKGNFQGIFSLTFLQKRLALPKMAERLNLKVFAYLYTNMMSYAGPDTAELVATKAKGLPRITISLDRVAASVLKDVIADFSLALYESYKTKQEHASRGGSFGLLLILLYSCNCFFFNIFILNRNKEILIYLSSLCQILFSFFCRTRPSVTAHAKSSL